MKTKAKKRKELTLTVYVEKYYPTMYSREKEYCNTKSHDNLKEISRDKDGSTIEILIQGKLEHL